MQNFPLYVVVPKNVFGLLYRFCSQYVGCRRSSPSNDVDAACARAFMQGSELQWQLLYPASPVEAGCRISQFSGYQNVMPDVYLGVSSTLKDRPNPIWHLMSCPVCNSAL